MTLSAAMSERLIGEIEGASQADAALQAYVREHTVGQPGDRVTDLGDLDEFGRVTERVDDAQRRVRAVMHDIRRQLGLPVSDAAEWPYALRRSSESGPADQ